jgi:hypothetical protein
MFDFAVDSRRRGRDVAKVKVGDLMEPVGKVGREQARRMDGSRTTDCNLRRRIRSLDEGR